MASRSGDGSPEPIRETVNSDEASRFVFTSAARKSFHTVNSMNPRITPYVVPRIPYCHPVTSFTSLRLEIGHNRFNTATTNNETAMDATTKKALCE